MKKFYVQVSHCGRKWTCELGEFAGVLSNEVKEAAECQSLEEPWTITLVEMEQSQYENFPEFMGY